VSWKITALQDKNNYIADFGLDFVDPRQAIRSFTTS
jgi:hypothetical protein